MHIKDAAREAWDTRTSWWARATSGVTLVTTAALISTALSFHGMLGTTTAALGMPLAVGMALAGFLELSVLGLARLLQNAIEQGRRATIERIGTWLLSFASGVFSAAHEFVGPVDADGVHHWDTGDPLTQIGAAIRLAAPLVACWLWERRLRGERAHAAQRRPRHVALRDRHIMRVSLAAALVRNAETTAPGDGRIAAALNALLALRRFRATARLRRRYVAYWRRYPLTDVEHHAALMDGLRAAGLGDLLPELTTPDPNLLPTLTGARPPAMNVAPDAGAVPAVPSKIHGRPGLDSPEIVVALDDAAPAHPVVRAARPVTPAERAEIIELAGTPGISEREIHRRTGRSRDTVKRVLNSHRRAMGDQERPADRPVVGFVPAGAPDTRRGMPRVSASPMF